MTDVGGPAWRRRRRDQLLGFAARARLDTGFGRLGRDGVPRSEPLELWINARFTFVFAAAVRAGDPSFTSLARHGVEALTGRFADPEHGGWWSAVGADGRPVTTAKSCYDHAFVLLAAATAADAGVPGGDVLLAEAGQVHETRFWSDAESRCVDERSRDWSAATPYRGANANMHTVEAYLAAAAADATAGDRWLERATSIARFFVDEQARQHAWRIPEHYDDHWRPLLRHNADRVDDAFRPYGATPGHGLEWARLLLELEERLEAPPARLLDGAQALFARAVADALSAAPGLPYTTDWDGTVVIAERFHWVVAEAVQAADALFRRTGEQQYADLRERWWSEIDRWFIEGDGGLWNHELDEAMQVSGRTWPDAPDVYHAYNALTERLPHR